MDSVTEKALENQAAAQDYDAESSFEVISDSDDPVSSETDHSAPAKPVGETPAPALMPDLGNEASSSIIVLAGSGSAGKNVLPATAELVAETPGCLPAPAPAPTPDTETENSASSSLVLLSDSGSTDKTVQSSPAKPVDETPAPTPDPETGNAASSSIVVLAGSGNAVNNVHAVPLELVTETTAPFPRSAPETGNAASSSLVVLAGSGSAGNNFQDENSLLIGQSDEEYRERDQRMAFFEKEREINNEPCVKDFDPYPELLFRRYLSCPELYNHTDSDDSDCSIDIIDDQNEVKPNNISLTLKILKPFNSNCSILTHFLVFIIIDILMYPCLLAAY